jgi:hypothetical protein
MNFQNLIVASFAAALLPSGAGAETLIIGYSPERHERFVADRGGQPFIGAGWDLSGVGRTGNGGFATHIGDGWFLSDARDRLSGGDQVSFYSENTLGSSASSSVAVDYGFRVGLSDVWLGRFTSLPVEEIASYPLATDLAGGEALVVVGSVVPSDPLSFAVGSNTSSAVGAMDTSSFYNAATFSTLLGGPDTLLDLAVRGGAERGAPTFVERDGQLALAGLHWKAGTDNLVGAQTGAIAVLQGFSPPVVSDPVVVAQFPGAIPEPGTVSLVAFALGLGLLRRGRK